MNRLKQTGLIVMAASVGLALCLNPTQVRADKPFPVMTTLQQLRDRTQVPILLPTNLVSVSNDSSSIFPSIATQANNYSVNFDLRPNCQGATACNHGSISGLRGGKLTNLKEYAGLDRSSTAKVKLKNGTPAQFASACGAYCSATLEWKSNNILYSVYVKNGSLKDTVAIANSAVTAGIRPVPKRAVLAYAVGARVELTSPGGSLNAESINIRDRASTQGKILHIGYARDLLSVLGQAKGTDSYGWYRVKFNVSGATGWVREDFVINSFIP